VIARAALFATTALLADAAAFALAVQHVGIRGESNPAIVAMHLAGGTGFILALKVAEVAVVLLVMAVLAVRLPEHRRRSWPLAVGWFAAAVGLFGAATGLLGALG